MAGKLPPPGVGPDKPVAYPSSDALGDGNKPVPLKGPDEVTNVVAKNSLVSKFRAWFSSKPSKITHVPKAKIKALENESDSIQVKAVKDNTSTNTLKMTKGWFPSWKWNFKSSALGRLFYKPKDAGAPKEKAATKEETAVPKDAAKAEAPVSSADTAVLRSAHTAAPTGASKSEPPVSTAISENVRLLESGARWLCSVSFAERHDLEGISYSQDPLINIDITRSRLEDLIADRSPTFSEEHPWASFILVPDRPPKETSTRQFLGFYSSYKNAKLAYDIGSDISIARGNKPIRDYISKFTEETSTQKQSLTYDNSLHSIEADKVDLSHFEKNMFNVFKEMDELQKSQGTRPTTVSPAATSTGAPTAASKVEAPSSVAAGETQLAPGTRWLCSNFFAERYELLGVSSSPDTSKIIDSMLTDVMMDRSQRWREDRQYATFVTVQDPAPKTTYTRQFLGFYSTKDKATLATQVGWEIAKAQGKTPIMSDRILITPQKLKEKRTLTIDSEGVTRESVDLSYFEAEGRMLDIFSEMDKLQKSPKAEATQAKAESPSPASTLKGRQTLLEKLNVKAEGLSVQSLESFVEGFSMTSDTEHPHALMATETGGGRICLGYFDNAQHAQGMLKIMRSIRHISNPTLATGEQISVTQNPFQLLFKQNRSNLACREIRDILMSSDRIRKETADKLAEELVTDLMPVRQGAHQYPAYIQKRTPGGTLEDELLGYYPKPLQADAMADVCKKLLTKGSDYYLNLKKSEKEPLGEKRGSGDVIDRLARVNIPSV